MTVTLASPKMPLVLPPVEAYAGDVVEPRAATDLLGKLGHALATLTAPRPKTTE